MWSGKEWLSQMKRELQDHYGITEAEAEELWMQTAVRCIDKKIFYEKADYLLNWCIVETAEYYALGKLEEKKESGLIKEI